MYMSHYSKTAGHPGGRKLNYTLIIWYYWPSVTVYFFATIHSCTEFSRERIKLINTFTHMKLFKATEPLSFVAIDIMGEKIFTKRGNRFLLVITNRFTKLNLKISFNRITATAVAHSFMYTDFRVFSATDGSIRQWENIYDMHLHKSLPNNLH